MDQRRTRVLFAEDDEAMRFVVREALELAGFRVEVAADAGGARAAAQGKPELILIDLALEGAEELIAELRQLVPAAPILLLVCPGDEAMARRACQRGASGSLAMPVRMSALSAELRRLQALQPA